MTLRLYLLGDVRLTQYDDPLTLAAQRAAVLLAYLALHPRPHGRETLATLLWDDRSHEQALTNLRSLLAQLPEALKPYITADRKTIALDESQPLWVDALALEQLLPTDPTAALALYHGPFMANVAIRDSTGLEEWLILQRERFQQLVLAGHHNQARHCLHTRQDAQGSHHTQQLLQIAPFFEEGLRLHLRLLARQGARSEALASYRAFRQRLAAELGVEPAAETTTLYERIRLVQWPIPHAVPPIPPLPTAEADVAAAASRLDDPHCRLLTLTGPAAASVALTVAHQRKGDYLHGIFVVPLAAVPTADHLATAVALAVGLPRTPTVPTADQLRGYLSGKECLLVLWQMDHFGEEGAVWVQNLLAAVPAVQIVATAPEPLYLRAEWVLATTAELPALPPAAPLPAADLLATWQTACQPFHTGPWVAALGQQWWAMQSAWHTAVAHANWAWLAQAWHPITMWGFQSGYAAEVATLLASATKPPTAALATDLLIWQALLWLEANLPANALPLLETAAPLATAAQRPLVAYAHAAIHAQNSAWAELEPWAAQAVAGHPEPWLATLTHFMWGNALLDQGQFTAAFPHLQEVVQVGETHGYNHLVARATNNIGNGYWYQGDYEQALAHFSKALIQARGTGNLALETLALGNVGLALSEQGHYLQGIQALEQALHCAQLLGDPREQANQLLNLGATLVEAADYGRARLMFHRALPLCRATGDAQGEAIVLDGLGHLASTIFHQHEEAEGYYEQALALYESIADELGLGSTLLNMAWMNYWVGRPLIALRQADQAIATAVTAAVQPLQAEAQLLRGHLLAETGHPAEAQAAYEQAAVLWQEMGQPHRLPELWSGWARWALRYESATAALVYVNKIIPELAPDSLLGAREPLRVYHSCVAVLAALGDGRVTAVRHQALTYLHHIAGRLENRHLRRAFLEDVPLHAAVMAWSGEGE